MFFQYFKIEPKVLFVGEFCNENAGLRNSIFVVISVMRMLDCEIVNKI